MCFCVMCWLRVTGPTSFDARGASSTALLGRLCSREKRLGLAPEELKLLEHFKDLLVRAVLPQTYAQSYAFADLLKSICAVETACLRAITANDRRRRVAPPIFHGARHTQG